MRTAKQIARYVITIALTLSIILLILVLLASSTIGSESYVLNKLEETSYYFKIYEDVKSNFENYIYQSGLDETALENVISEEKVKKDTNLVISNIYNGLDEKIDSQTIKDNLNTNIDKIVGTKSLNANQKKAIETLIQKICDEYTQTILHFGYENAINDVYQKVMKYIDLAKKAMMISVAICIILLVSLTTRRIYRVFNFISIAFISSGLFLVVTNMVINARIKIQAITILNEAISIAIRKVLTEVMQNMTTLAYGLIAIGFIVIIIANLIHNINKYKENEEIA